MWWYITVISAVGKEITRSRLTWATQSVPRQLGAQGKALFLKEKQNQTLMVTPVIPNIQKTKAGNDQPGR